MTNPDVNQIVTKRQWGVLRPERVFTLTTLTYLLLSIMGLWGCLAIYNATALTDTPYYFVGRQFVWFLIGVTVLLICSKVKFSTYQRLIPLYTGVAYVLLLGVLFLGIRINGMRGWYGLGDVFFQPTEFAKAPFILSLVWVCNRYDESAKRYGMMLLVTCVWLVPIGLQPDFGAVLIFMAGFVIVYWISGGNWKYLLAAGAVGIPVVVFAALRHDYVWRRLDAFMEPGWHVRQFQYTMARGGFWGTDWGKALWANSYLPLAHTDSAYASLTESVGFVGAFPIIVGFVALVYISYRLAMRLEGQTEKQFVFAMTMLFAIQAMLHMSVNVTMFPTTGLTLPLLSYGGSSLVSTMLAFGIVLSAANTSKVASKND